MIKITVEIYPPLITGKSLERIASAIIVNDGTGTKLSGNYVYSLWLKRKSVWRQNSIKGFKRKQRNIWWLLVAILKKELL